MAGVLPGRVVKGFDIKLMISIIRLSSINFDPGHKKNRFYIGSRTRFYKLPPPVDGTNIVIQSRTNLNITKQIN